MNMTDTTNVIPFPRPEPRYEILSTIDGELLDDAVTLEEAERKASWLCNSIICEICA